LSAPYSRALARGYTEGVNQVSRMHLIEIFLPLRDNEGSPFAASNYADIRKTLTEKFGGLTAFSRAPADGTDKEGGRERHDELAVFEVMTDAPERDWWSAYRKELERRFRQDRILIRMSDVTLL
jgi:hypothetical protein